MKSQQILIVFGVLAISFGTTLTATVLRQQQIDEEWTKFKQTFGRSYNLEEEQQRKAVFSENLDMIYSHNQKYEAGQSSYQLGVNQFADWTREEFRNIVTRRSGSKPLPGNKQNWSQQKCFDTNTDDLPAEVDWTKKGVVTPVQSMGNCGDGYAFGPVATVESAHALKTGQLVELSVQQVVDCSMRWGNMNCEGGYLSSSFDYIQKYGLDTQKSYPYVANESSGCHADNKPIGATIKDYVVLPMADEQSMQAAVAKIGPVAITMDADSPHFMHYKSGVYDYQDCNMIFIDHGMAAVGYGTLNGKKYWKIKNSMGTSWGEDGYLLIARDEGSLCGVATTPMYPIL